MKHQLDPSQFYGCYILRSVNPQYPEHCYIGFTGSGHVCLRTRAHTFLIVPPCCFLSAVDPRRRIDQHNGELDGGAKKTSKKRPWEMVLVVYGFPSSVAALRFEWCWQNPTESLLTRHALDAVPKAQKTKERLAAKVRVLYEMLHVAPFNRYPLNVLWLLKDKDKFRSLLEECRPLPKHVSVHNSFNAGTANCA